MLLSRKKRILELWQFSPCLPGSGGSEQVGGMERVGQTEFKPSHYASRYRDQKTTLQINKASTWAEPLSARMGGRGVCSNEQTASSPPAGRTGSGLLQTNPVAR